MKVWLLIVIILLCALIFGGLGFATWYYLKQRKNQEGDYRGVDKSFGVSDNTIAAENTLINRSEADSPDIASRNRDL